MSAKNTPPAGNNLPPTTEITYADKIGMMLEKLPLRQVFKLAGQVKKENRQQFVDIVKSYIDRNMGHQSGWEIVFSSDYSALKKIPREVSAPIQKNIYELQNVSPEVLATPAIPSPPTQDPPPAPEPPKDIIVRSGFPVLPKHRPSDPVAARYLKQFCYEDVFSVAQEFCSEPITEEQFQNYIEQKELARPETMSLANSSNQ